MTQPILTVDNLVKHFQTDSGETVHAVDNVTFELFAGETLSLVGESGCGKSTLGKTIIRLFPPTSGSVRVLGQEVADVSRRAMRPLRREIQMVFQDPFASLNPRVSVGRAIEEPLIVHSIGTRKERRDRVAWLLEKVGLSPDVASRHPHEFSGGQRQRIGIARALALQPKIIICDEPVSALDVSVQAQVINLLMALQDEFGLSYLFVAHDLAVVEHISHRVAVMYLGRIVELAGTESLFTRPQHPYTVALLSAVPVPDPKSARKRIILPGDVPSPIDPPPGCRFHTRCPLAEARCRVEVPAMKEVAPGHFAACHLREGTPA
jgi:oligopeptide/dipeptide ABC transporter ATP-binding protein